VESPIPVEKLHGVPDVPFDGFFFGAVEGADGFIEDAPVAGFLDESGECEGEPGSGVHEPPHVVVLVEGGVAAGAGAVLQHAGEGSEELFFGGGGIEEGVAPGVLQGVAVSEVAGADEVEGEVELLFEPVVEEVFEVFFGDGAGGGFGAELPVPPQFFDGASVGV